MMKITFWGCRGSIPVPDSRMIRYGGNTTCVEVSTEQRTLIIDAGSGIRKLGEHLTRKKVDDLDVFITHSHWDHIQGFPFFTPIYSPKTRINIIGCTNSYKQLKSVLAHQMSYEYFPISFLDLKSTITFTDACNYSFTGKDYTIRFIQTNHPIFTLGVRLEHGGKSLVFITDNELGQASPITPRDHFVEFCHGANYLIHDAQFLAKEYPKRRGWGHSTFEEAVELARDAHVKNLGFFHHDPSRRDTELASIERRFQKKCAKPPYGFNVFAVREMQSITLK